MIVSDCQHRNDMALTSDCETFNTGHHCRCRQFTNYIMKQTTSSGGLSATCSNPCPAPSTWKGEWWGNHVSRRATESRARWRRRLATRRGQPLHGVSCTCQPPAATRHGWQIGRDPFTKRRVHVIHPRTVTNDRQTATHTQSHKQTLPWCSHPAEAFIKMWVIPVNVLFSELTQQLQNVLCYIC